MGVPIGDADGESIALLRCKECTKRYETDETMDNQCPCGSYRYSIEDASYGQPWRET